MRVLHVIETLEHHAGRFAMTLPGLLAALRRRGVQCDVLGGVAGNAHVQSGLAAERIVVAEETTPVAMRREIEPLVRAADVVHIHSAMAEVSKCTSVAARRLSTPLVVSTYGDLLRGLRGRGKFSIWMENRCFRRQYRSAGSWPCVNETEAQMMRARGLEGPFAVLPVGYDGDATRESPNVEAPGLPWNDGKRVLAYLGDIDGRVGLVQFLKACDELEDELQEWRIVIAGRPVDNWLELFRAGVRRHGKEHLVEFISDPDVCQQAAIREAAEFVVLPTLTPAPPVAALWAMWAYKPLLVSQAADLPGIQERGAGEVVEPSRKGFLGGLEKMVTASAEQLHQRGQAAGQLVRDRHSWSTLIDRYFDLYRSLAG